MWKDCRLFPLRRGLVWGIAVSALSLSSLAQTTSPPPPEPEVVTVSARALPISSVSASVTLVTREEIENSRAQTVEELLRTTPFLHVSRVGSRGGLSSITIRGGDPNFTLIMIDGVPVNDPTNLLGGAYDLSSLSLDNLERIEIVRGPLSSVYGSEAIGGVINLISRQGEGRPSFSVTGLLGNFSAWQAGVTASGEMRSLSYAVSASRLDLGEQVENDSHSLGTISWNSRLRLKGDQDLRFSFRLNDRDSSGFPENGGGPEFSILRDPKTVDAREIILGFEYRNRKSRAWQFRAAMDYYGRDENAFTPAILDSLPPGPRTLPSFSAETRLDRLRLRFSNSWNLPAGWAADLAVSVRQEDGESQGLIADFLPSDFFLERSSLLVSGELRCEIGDLHLNLGAGLDKSEGFESDFSPRLGVSYLIAESGARVRASWGEGYKLPSFFALGEPNIGNPDLKAERSRGFDVGIEQELGTSRVLLGLNYFHNTFLDLIDFSPQQFRLVHRTRSTTRGVEFEAGARLSEGLRLKGSLTYVDAEIEGTTEPLRDRPRWRGEAGIEWRPGQRGHLSFQTQWVGPRFDFQLPVADRDQVGGYSHSSLAAGYRFRREVELFGRIDNLFDRRYHEFIGFPDPGIFARIGLRYRFGL